MKKRAYRAVDVKQISPEQLLLEPDMKVVLGIDIAKEQNFCSVMDTHRQVLATVKWQHPFETPKFIEFAQKFSKLEVAMEPSGTYGDPIKYQLEKSGITVFRVSPKRSHDAAEVYDGVPSLHDAKSAAIIAKLHLDGASERWDSKELHERDLFAAITTLDTLTHQFHQHTNKLEALMGRHWPEINKYFKFSQVTYLKLASEIGGACQVASKQQEARTLMKKTAGSWLKAEKLEGVIKAAATSVGVPMTHGELTEFKYLASRTLELKRELDKCKHKVEKLSQDNEASKHIGNVVGKATSAVFISFCGDPLKYHSCNHWLKSFGLNLKEKSSGKYKGRLTITKRGSGRSRKWLYFAVLRLLQKDAIVKAWYARKVERDGGIKKKAITAIMRKLVKALWHVARGRKFDTSKLFDVQKLRLAN